MHEISLVRNIIANLESEYSRTDLDHLLAIDLKVGRLSHAEPALLQSAFKAVTKTKKRYLRVRLNIELVPIQIRCSECDQITTVQHFKFRCVCGKPSNDVVSGTELQIHRLHFED